MNSALAQGQSRHLTSLLEATVTFAAVFALLVSKFVVTIVAMSPAIVVRTITRRQVTDRLMLMTALSYIP